MLHGAMVIIGKEKDGSRKIPEAIDSGIKLYQKHSKVLALELIALVNPRIYLECKLEGKIFSIDVDWHKDVPYGNMMVCKKGDKE